MSEIIKTYDENAEILAQKFLGLTFEQAHPDLEKHFPYKRPMAMADIGAGAGRDALALAGLGHYVMAVEPSRGLRKIGEAHTKGGNVIWADDALPDLASISTYPQKYDFILCNAVWMHLPPEQRPLALAAMSGLLTRFGRIYIKAFDGTGQQREGRAVYPFHPDEFKGMAAHAGLRLAFQDEQKDLLGKQDVRWYAARLDRIGF